MLKEKSSTLSLYSLWLLILFFAGFSCANAAFTSIDFLKTNGTVISNNSGTGSVVNLRGTNLGGWLLRENWMSPAGATDEYSLRQILMSRFGEAGMQTLLNTYDENWLQASDLDNIKQLGMNVVRVPIYWEDFMNRDGSMKPDAIAFHQLDWLVSEAGARNIYVILDLHGTPGAACPWQSCGRDNFNQLWSNATYQNWTVQIWQRLATHYNGNPAVAAYDLLNEPLVTMGASENPTQVKQKMDFFNRLYQAVRAIDPNHIVMIAAFFDWWAASPPTAYGWTNVVYQTHHYQFNNYDDWEMTNAEINRWLKDLAAYQRNWNVPIYAGEFSFGQNDLFEKWLNGLNTLNASWTNWSYKIKGGGNWGFFINNNNPYPDLQNDSAATIASKWAMFTTAHFAPNTGFTNLVKKYTTAPAVTVNWSSVKALANGTFVAAENAGNGPLVANRAAVGDWERFKVINNTDGTISLWSMINNKFVQADLNNNGRIIASATFINGWEKFMLVDMGNGKVALKSLANNKFVCADLNAGAVLYANRTVANTWETFTITNA